MDRDEPKKVICKPLEKRCCDNCGIRPYCNMPADERVDPDYQNKRDDLEIFLKTCDTCLRRFDCFYRFKNDRNICDKWVGDKSMFTFFSKTDIPAISKEIADYCKNDMVSVPKAYNNITNPDHYTAGRKYEPRKVIEDWGLNFYTGNVVKYISRAGRKGGSMTNAIEDLKKAAQYLEWEIERLEKLSENKDNEQEVSK